MKINLKQKLNVNAFDCFGNHIAMIESNGCKTLAELYVLLDKHKWSLSKIKKVCIENRDGEYWYSVCNNRFTLITSYLKK